MPSIPGSSWFRPVCMRWVVHRSWAADTATRRSAPRSQLRIEGPFPDADRPARALRPFLLPGVITMMRIRWISFCVLFMPTALAAQVGRDTARATLLVPDAVWDGTSNAPARGWAVLVRGGRIEAAGPAASIAVPPGAERVDLTGTTLIPGLIEGHSHLFLHPYN